ncbi:MAG TPA: alkaline phosphatase D family protein, partial [Polyangiaceae bacterium]
GSELFIRVWFESLDANRLQSEPLLARFRTAPGARRAIRFLWSGDTAGQGWGIDLAAGGMQIYESMRNTKPDFFIHSGDNIYADGPMTQEVKDRSGAVIWRNAFLDVIPEKLKVAETLQEFRRAYLYNRYDQHLRAFSAEVPQIWQWDDHEVLNNWSNSSVLDARYTERRVQTLAAYANRAFLEYSPLRWSSLEDSERIYRHLPYGPDLDVFVLDLRSYRAGNSCNTQPQPGPETAYFGRAQLDWLKDKLKHSKATWKAIACDMPLGLLVGDGLDPVSNCPRYDNSANGDGPVLGRELEIAELLRFVKTNGIRHLVWFTADVHYAAAHYYNPALARFRDFEPFWEFVAGPLHAGAFGPNLLDDTFGPTVIFQKAPPEGQANQPPSAGFQAFGQVDIDPRSKDMLVTLKDGSGAELFKQRLKFRS